MRPSGPKTVMVDSGAWFALLEPRDEHHHDAASRADRLDGMRLAVPWPSLYETLNSRLARNPTSADNFRRILRRPNAELLNDAKYRDTALNLTFEGALAGKRPLSLVDWVIRLMLDDPGIRVHAFWTYNKGDFADACRRRGVELI